MRVQIPAYTDRWMMGDRYGEVVKVTHTISRRVAGIDPTLTPDIDIAHVKLDRSGKTIRVILDDCNPI